MVGRPAFLFGVAKEPAVVWRQHMRRGDFEPAWRISDRVLQNRHRFRRGSCNQESTWRGEPLHGKRVLVRCCYGLGDTLQFARYLPLLRHGARCVILQAQASVARVLEHVQGIDRLATRYNCVPPETYDVAIHLSELPHLFRTRIQTIPTKTRYINIEPRTIPPSSSIRVGLVWQGSDWDPRRSVPLQLFAGFERIAGVTLHILQRGHALLERPIGFGIDSGNDDLYEAARTMAALDLIVTIDSMPAHLAGALGVPTWVLLHSECDWRWMKNRIDSPWYATMHLFRQKNAGDWRPVIAEVKQELEPAVSSRHTAISMAA
ncbi:MAG: ADP-heptose--LPS heptosyltransferase [Nitrospirota bacterium]